MGRKRQEVNPAQAEHLQEFKKRLQLTQRTIEEKGQIPDQRLSKILSGKGSLQEYQAKALAEAFPPYRWQWLYGLDDIPTTDDLLLLQRSQYSEMAGDEAAVLHSVVTFLASMCGYYFTYGSIGKTEIEASCENESSWYRLFQGDTSISLSRDELQKLELKLIDYAGLLFCNVLYGRGENNGED